MAYINKPRFERCSNFGEFIDKFLLAQVSVPYAYHLLLVNIFDSGRYQDIVIRNGHDFCRHFLKKETKYIKYLSTPNGIPTIIVDTLDTYPDIFEIYTIPPNYSDYSEAMPLKLNSHHSVEILV